MTKTFSDYLSENSNFTFTENGALTHQSTLNAVLDLFAVGGAARNLKDYQKADLVKAAYVSNKELTLRTIFYLGDIRGGAGERSLFKTALTVLMGVDPSTMTKLVDLIPEYTRWDYVYELIGTPAENAVIELIRAEHARVQSDKINNSSLMYKWLKSPNTSSKESCKLGRWTAAVLGFSKDFDGTHAYQKLLSFERAKLKEAVVEKPMSQNKWHNIDYSKVPSKASLKYNRAFSKHDTVGYTEYIKQVNSGEKKMNMSVTFPHEIVAAYNSGNYRSIRESNVRLELEAAWKSLPNFINNDENVIVVADTSGSMSAPIGNQTSVMAIDVAHALSIYCAERLSGVFHNKVISFSSNAKFFDIGALGNNLIDKIRLLWKNSIVSDTNLQSVFDLILITAVSNKVPSEQLPTKIIIISDMEFNSCQDGATNFANIKRKYAESGYEMPEVIFWNVNARNVQFPVLKTENGVALVSGYSTSLLSQLLNGKILTPIDNMLKIIGDSRYDAISERLK